MDNPSHLLLLQGFSDGLFMSDLSESWTHFSYIWLANWEISEIGLYSFVDFQNTYSSFFILMCLCLLVPNYSFNLTCLGLYLSNTLHPNENEQLATLAVVSEFAFFSRVNWLPLALIKSISWISYETLSFV